MKPNKACKGFQRRRNALMTRRIGKNKPQSLKVLKHPRTVLEAPKPRTSTSVISSSNQTISRCIQSVPASNASTERTGYNESCTRPQTHGESSSSLILIEPDENEVIVSDQKVASNEDGGIVHENSNEPTKTYKNNYMSARDANYQYSEEAHSNSEASSSSVMQVSEPSMSNYQGENSIDTKGENFSGSENSRDGNDVIRELLSKQTAILDARRHVLLPRGFNATHRILPFSATNIKRSITKKRSSIGGQAGIRDNWRTDLQLLNRIKPNFFTSSEARMEISDRVKTGCTAYERLPISHENNADIQKIFQASFEPQIKDGASNGSYIQFLVAIGQFARLSVVLNKINAAALCEPGALWRQASNIDLLKIFLNYFDIRGSPSTVMGKAAHLKKLLQLSCIENDKSACIASSESCNLASQYLNSVFNYKKKICRALYSQRRSIESRIESGAIMFPRDFTACTSIAKRKLSGVMKSFEQWCGKEQQQNIDHVSVDKMRARQFFNRHSPLLDKWCINLLALLMLVAGGQRPQVYCQIQSLSNSQLDHLHGVSSNRTFIELRTIREKTPRSANMPFVMVPRSLLTFLNFHVRAVRPILFGRMKHSSEERSRDLCERNIPQPSLDNESEMGPLLLHTKTGLPLKTEQVTSSFRKFVSEYDPELTNLSSMSLRASFATAMFSAFKSGQLFKGRSQDFFFEHIASLMNTSVDQMKSTYISIDHLDFQDSARAIMKAMNTLFSGEDADVDELGEIKDMLQDAGTSTIDESPQTNFSFLEM